MGVTSRLGTGESSPILEIRSQASYTPRVRTFSEEEQLQAGLPRWDTRVLRVRKVHRGSLTCAQPSSTVILVETTSSECWTVLFLSVPTRHGALHRSPRRFRLPTRLLLSSRALTGLFLLSVLESLRVLDRSVPFRTDSPRSVASISQAVAAPDSPPSVLAGPHGAVLAHCTRIFG